MITATVVGLAQRAGATSLLQPPLFLAAVMIPVVNHLDEWSAAVRRVDRVLFEVLRRTMERGTAAPRSAE
jgi:hypothetical protein